MKKAVQQAHELTSHNRTNQTEYSTNNCQSDSSRVSSVRNIRVRFETGAEKGNVLRNGNSSHYRRSDSVKSRSVDARVGDIVVSAKTKVPDTVVVNGTLSIGSPVSCRDRIVTAENVDSTQHKPNGSSEFLRPSLVDTEKAQDRLLKSQSYIEQLQQNLATKLSTATVETFRHEYSPTLGPRSPSKAGRFQLSDIKPNEKGNHDSREAVGFSTLTNGNQKGDRNNRQTPVPKESVGKGDTSVSEFKRRKLQFLGVIFRSTDTRPTRKLTNSPKNDTSTPDESADSGQFLNGVAHPVENESTQLGSEYRNQDFVDSSPPIASQNSLEGVVKNGDTVQGNNSSSVTPLCGVNNPNCGKLSDESQQQTHTTPKSVDAIPLTKPARVSWTTRLIQKLTEEEEKRKIRSQTKVQKAKHIVGFPQKRVKKVANQYRAEASEESKKESESPLVLQLTTGVSTKGDTVSGSRKKEIKENLSGVVLDENSKDAYANLLSQLTDSENEDNQQVSELTEEDLILKQKKLEELRATLAREEAREECVSTSSDDDSAFSVAITASTGSIEAGRRKEPKPSGIRRLLTFGMVVQKHRHIDRAEEDAALERLLKNSGASRVYPASNTARPVLETAFLSDSNSKLPVRSAVRQQQRSQSSSPASRHKQASPRSRRRQKDVDQKSIQENEQNSSKISNQARSKSLSPATDRRSSTTHPTSRRTIPDTSLVLEKRLQNIRRELSPPPGRDVRRPSSTPPTDHLKRVPQSQNSSNLSSNKILQQERINKNVSAVYSDTPYDAYYHSPPSRRRQQNKDLEIDHTADDKQRKLSGGSSASSTSTIVAESPPLSALSWNPLLLNLENQALSRPPDIRELQQQRQPQHRNHDGEHYGGIQNIVQRDTRTDSPDIYYHPNSGFVGKPTHLLEIYYDPFLFHQRSPTPVPSGRLSAPPVSSYIEDYPRRRIISPEPPRSLQEYQDELSSKRSLSQPPRLRQSTQTFSTQPLFQTALPTDKRMVSPIAAQLHVTSQSRPREAENAKSKETQTGRSYMQQQYRQLEEGIRSSSHPRYKKLSRQEVEVLYWETQKLKAGLSSLSQRVSHSPRLEESLLSTVSPHQPPPPAPHRAVRSEQNSPMLCQPEAVPQRPVRTQSVQNVGSGYRSVIVRPQPLYNNAQQYQMMQQSRASNDSNVGVSRGRSASPGVNSNRHLPSRSLSLPRSIPAPLMPEAFAHKASDDTVDHFKRGVPQRNTIGPIRTASSHSPQSRQLSPPTIFEEAPQQVAEDTRVHYVGRQTQGNKVDGGRGNKSNKVSNSKSQYSADSVMNRSPLTGDQNDYKKSVSSKKNKKSLSEEPVPQQRYYPPIFKRGSLISTSTSSVDGVDSPVSPKRVSFTRSYTDEPANWPTRKGTAPQPPTRQRKLNSVDSEVFLPFEAYSTYANVQEAPNRPLPPVPRDVNGAVYGMILRKSPAHRWQHQSESESGSEAGEVQRILQQGSHGRGTYFRFAEEEWGADGKSRGPSGTDQSVSNVGRDEEVRRGGGGGGRSGRRDEPRRHTLSGDHHHHQQGGALARSMDLEMSSKSQRRKSPLPRGYPPPSSAMLFDDDPGIMSEVETSSTGFRRGGKQRSSLPVVRTPSKTLERPLGKTSGAGVSMGVGPMPRISPHPSAMATHHHQMVHLVSHHHGLSNNKHSSAAASGGLVFLQYRSETKRALLPNEITSIDTVKALFVRSFPKQLTMEYLDSPHVKIYIHDSSKDMFYELEDLRSHLRDIRDRSVLRLFESTDMNGGVLPGAGVGVVAPPMWDQDQSYFSEPEFDSEYQHQHIHKTKASSKSGSSGGVPPQAPYYMTHSYPPGGAQGAPGASATLPRGGPLLRAYSPAVAPSLQSDRIKTLPQTDRLHSESGYMSSPERGGPRAYPAAAYPPGPGYEDPYYSQYASRSGSITPVIDEEASDTELIDESYSLYGVKLPTAGRSVVTPQPRSQFPAPAVVPYDTTRIRVEHMERQLANLTGLVQKALTQTPTPREYLQVPPPASARDANYRNAASDEYDKHSSSSSASLPDDSYLRTDTKPPKLGKDKSVSFEKSVSFSDEPPDMNSPKQHSPQHAADSKPPKPAIKSSTLPRMSSQERTERDRHKPAPPPKPVSLSPGQYEGRHVYRDLQLTPEMYNQLRGLQKKAKDLRQEVRNLRRMSQAQAHSVRETIRDTFLKIRAMLLIGGEEAWAISGDADKVRLNREEDAYKQEMLRLENDLTELEGTVEELRGNVINRKTRVNMSDVENMALILNKSSKTVADLKVRFPSLQEGMKGLLASEMEKVVREEKFLKEEPDRLESALRRCKKLTGTLVTLKRLASVQEQRLPPSATPESRLSPTMGLGGDSDTPITPPAHGKPSAISARSVMAPTIGGDVTVSRQRSENALDALLDELQTFARPPYRAGSGHNPSMADIGRKGSIDSAHTHAPSLPSSTGTSSLRRLHSYPSSSDGGGNSPPTVALARLQVSGSTGADTPKSPATSPKPPVPERNSELLSHLAGRRIPPPPPPRTSSRSPLASPTSPSLPPRGQHPPSQPQMGVGGGTLLRRGGPGRSSLREPLRGTPGISVPSSTAMAKQEDPNQLQPGFNPLSASNSSSCESINSQEGLQQNKAVSTGSSTGNKARQEILEQRHQELLRKQRALQEQYARLQQLQRSGGGGLTVVPPPDLLLKKTGSESNLLAKMGLGHNLSAAAPISGSLTHLAAVAASANQQPIVAQQPQKQVAISTTPATTMTNAQPTNTTTTTTTTNKIYETDIL